MYRGLRGSMGMLDHVNPTRLSKQHQMSPYKTPQEIFTGEKPKISHLHVFGCGAYVYLPNEVCANKLILHSELMIFIGYEDNGYRFIHHT